MYNLPNIRQLFDCTPSKLDWKRQTKQAVSTYWTTRLVEDAMTKSTLTHCFTGNLMVGQVHMGRNARKPVFGGLRTTQTQTSLRIRAD